MEQNLKPFNLIAALAGDPVITRDGNEVLRVINIPEVTESKQVLCIIKNSTDNALIYYYKNGRLFECLQSSFDLFMKPVEKEYWTVSYQASGSKHTAIIGTFNSEDDANKWIERHAHAALRAQAHKFTRLE